MKQYNAYDELLGLLNPGEVVEAIVLGRGRWERWPDGEDPRGLLPADVVGVPLSLADAEPHMRTWRFGGGHGQACNRPAVVWTDSRIITVGEYDGATRLVSLPRHPAVYIPENIGG